MRGDQGRPDGTGKMGADSERTRRSARKLLKELDESFRKGGDKHSPNAKSWTDRVRDLFK